SGGITIGGDGNLIENNEVHDQIRGISLIDGQPRNSIVRNNTVYNHTGAGILSSGPNNSITNNTAYNNVPNYVTQ
ncbi:MAG: right-handed parallel beta-helix repeat-containing protein, partial [Nitrospira sp.]|nr:right-handed parallel beta-helix repeat-containing protein [Nitrospira sp.]